jgi:hypothetical protein
MSDADRASITNLHTQSQSPGPEGDELRSSLDRYDRWLATLEPSERQRIVEAASNKERIERVKEILQQQSMALEESLLPIRSTSAVTTVPGAVPPAELAVADPPASNPSTPEPAQRPNAKRPSFIKQRFDMIESEIERLDELEGKFTEEERRRLDQARGGQKVPLMMALATKYAIPLPPFVEEGQAPILQFFMGLLPEPGRILGTTSAADLSDDNRKKLGAIMVDLIMLPDLSQEKQFTMLQTESAKVRAGMEKISKVTMNKTTSRFLTNVLYYVQHPEDAPESTRDSVAMIPPEHLRELIVAGNARLFGSRPPRAGDLSRPNRPDRRPNP